MSNNPQPGDIVTVEDFMDTLVKYLMPPVPNYQDKITLIFKSGLRMSILRDQVMGTHGHNYTNGDYNNDGCPDWVKVAGQMKIGEQIPPHHNGTNFSGRGPSPKVGAETLVQIVDPSDNTIYNGIDKHTFEGKMPVPGELISIPDITSFLINSGSKMYKWTVYYVYDWNCTSYENIRNTWPVWSNPGGSGWTLRNQYQFQKLDDPVSESSGGLYETLPNDMKFKDNQLISIYHLQKVLSNMYMDQNQGEQAVFHSLVCHHNCHNRCHCARW